MMPFEPKSFRLAQPFANARPDAPSDLDGDSDSPDAAAGAAGTPTIMRTTSYKPWKYMYPRTWSISVYSDALGMGTPGSSARRSAIRSAITTCPPTCSSR